MAESQSTYRMTGDRSRSGQLSLDLLVMLDPPCPLGELRVGDRFLLESAGVEGRFESRGTGSATVALWRAGDERWTRTTWSLSTEVRRMRA